MAWSLLTLAWIGVVVPALAVPKGKPIDELPAMIPEAELRRGLARLPASFPIPWTSSTLAFGEQAWAWSIAS
jgi:hypothetical protein